MTKYFFYSSDLDEVSTRSRNFIIGLGGVEQFLEYFKKHNSFSAIYGVGIDVNEELIAFSKFLLEPDPVKRLMTSLDNSDGNVPLRKRVYPDVILQEFASGISIKELAQKYDTSVQYLREFLMKYDDDNYVKAKKLFHEKKTARWYEGFLSLISSLGRAPSIEEAMKHLNLPYPETYRKLKRAAIIEGYLPEYRNRKEDLISKKCETLLAYLKELAIRLGQAPTVSDLAKDGKYSASTFVHYFGNLSTAQQAAGLPPTRSDTAKELLRKKKSEQLQQWSRTFFDLIKELNRVPSMEETVKRIAIPNKRTYLELRSAAKREGFGKLVKEYRHLKKRDAMIAYLKEAATRLGRTPTSKDLVNERKYYTAEFVNHFGSLTKAQELARLAPNYRGNSHERAMRRGEFVTREMCIKDLKNLHTKLGYKPGMKEAIEYGSYSIGLYKRGLENDITDYIDYRPKKKITHEYSATEKQDMLNFLAQLAQRLGHTPSIREITSAKTFSVKAYGKCFGSLTNAQKLAGLLPNKSGNSIERALLNGQFVTREMCIEDLKKLEIKLGHKPGMKEVIEYGSYSVPLYRRGLGNDITDYIDYIPNKKITREYSATEKQDMIDFLAQLAQRLGHTPTKANINDAKKYSAQEYSACFGSLSKAQVLAGLEPTVRDIWNGPKPVTHEERKEVLLVYLSGLAKKYGYIPTHSELEKEGKFKRSMYRTYFGTFSKAKKAAALILARESDSGL